jgi:hypothetical protein
LTKYTDPTGHYWQIAVAVALMTISATTDDPTIAKVIAIAGMLLMGDALAGEGGAGLSAAESGAVIGFTQGTLNSANLGEGVKQGVISGVTAYAVSEIAHGSENGASEFTTAEQLALQGLVSGISTELRRGRFQDGFVSAIVSKGVDLGLEGQQLDFYTEGTIAMITGGLAAKAGGGSFEDGAVQAGMVHLYNAWGTIIQYGVKTGKELFKKGSRSGFKSDRVLNNLKIKGKKVSTDIEKGGSGLNNIHLKVGKTKYYYDGKSFYTPNGVRVPKSVLKNNAVQKILQKALDLHAKGF